jgi:adenylate cyclase
MNKTDLQQVIDWLIDGARSAVSPPRMMAEACERLVHAGLPLWRVSVFVRTLHPDIFGRSFVWQPGVDVVVASADFAAISTEPVVDPLREGARGSLSARRSRKRALSVL